jgi:tetratricopeptide (TPR) repeat protein
MRDPASPFPGSPLTSGDRLGGWTLLRPLGAGGAGQVWAARDDAGREVALKVFAADLTDATELRRIAREAAALEALDHPHVVRFVGAGEDDGRRWLAMSWIDGRDVEALVAGWAHSPPPDRGAQAERILRGLCAALSAVHAAGLLHRDVKPANVLVDARGEAHLTDFGIARATDSGVSTPPGHLAGTVAWMAPEAIAEIRVDARTDLYGVGAVLYHMLTGRRPFEADSVAGYLARHLSDRPTPPHVHAPGVPARLERICLRLLEKEPALRYGSAEAVLAALDGAVGTEPPRLHGRGELLSALSGRLVALGDGVGGRVGITGPPGAGRTAVLEVLLHAARERGLAVAWAGAGAPVGGAGSVLLIDEADNAPSSVRGPWAEAEAALAGGEPRLIVAAGRTVPWGPSGPEPTMWKLEPWSGEVIGEVLRDWGLDGELARALGARLHDSATAWPAPLRDQLRVLVEEGWVGAPGGGEAARSGASTLVARRPLSWFLDRDLPPTEAVSRTVRQRLARMDAEMRELVELMSVVERPVAASLLARASARPARVPAVLPGLMSLELVNVRTSTDDHVLVFRQPGMATAVRALMSSEVASLRHRAVAVAMQRQRLRGAPWAEIGRHLAAAGDAVEARGALEKGAEAARSGGRWSELLDVADVMAEVGSPVALVEGLRGRGWLGLGKLPEAIEALRRALEAQPSGPARMADEVELADALRRVRDPAAAEQILAAQRWDEVGPALDALRVRALTLRGAVRFHRGDLDEARRSLGDAVRVAASMGAPEPEARARRLLGVVLAMQLRLDEAAQELTVADDLLAAHGDPSVRARVLFYAVVLDRVVGRLAVALHRAEVLSDLCVGRGLQALLPSVLALQAEVLAVAGQSTAAAEVARRAVRAFTTTARQARGGERLDADGLLRAARVLADLVDAGVLEPGEDPSVEALATLGDRLPDGGLVDVPGQRLALDARRAASRARRSGDEGAQHEAAALAAAVLARPPPLDPRAWFDQTMDAAKAAWAVGDRPLAWKALARLERDELRRMDGLWLEVLALRRALGVDGAAEEIEALALRLAPGVPERCRAGWWARVRGDATRASAG